MIRKSIIIALTAGGLAVAFSLATSFDAGNRQTWPQSLDSYVYYRNPQRCFYITSLRGWVRTGTVRLDRPFELPPPNHREGWAWLGSRIMPEPDGAGVSGHLGGLVLTYGMAFASGTIRAVAIPHWTLCMSLLAYPVIVFIRGPLRRWRRRRRGLCLRCGYDLAGNESGVCPECGKEYSKESNAH